MDTLKNDLKAISLMVSTLTHDDIQGLGTFLNALESLEKSLGNDMLRDVLTVSSAMRSYIESMVFGEKTDMKPVKDGLFLMNSMVKQISKGEIFTFDFKEIIDELLGGATAGVENSTIKVPQVSSTPSPVRALEDDDEEILGDFITESRENLETIEVNLIDLEENPDDKEIINAIFRPFHTIKGISGFLDLRKINALGHSTENLLDSARKGQFVIDHDMTDVILQSVDVLKKLIDTVEKGLEIRMTADDSGIDIDSLVEKIERMNRAGSQPESPCLMGELLVNRGALEMENLEEALTFQKEHPEKKLGQILVEENGIDSGQVISVLREQKRVRKTGVFHVKVDTGKLDNLVDLTGELVIAQSMLRENTGAAASSNQKLNQNLNQLGQIVSNIQKIAMSMRMVPISATFQKMVRLVRDLSKSCNKDVGLAMSGEDTEIDRNVVEALYEPMVHMIRNSIDHGLETAEKRAKTRKPEKGSIRLRAYHKGGNIVIEISDDGQGLNAMTIFDKAVKLGLVDAHAVLADSEIFQLIMKPGFSTAKEITDISGRGVGMDVVKKAIEGLSGRVDIQSVEGEGSTFIITLPLTLAIIEGMLVRIGHERFIVPTMAILESFKPRKADYFTVEGKGEMLMFRKHLIPVIRLNKICHVTMDHQEVWNNIAIVVENNKEQRGILIDELLGKEEYVIKSLGESLKGIKGLAGGAIMGDGRVGLILDIGGLFEVANTL
ncbi:MAG: chemotaxis protein CheA [Proteobacteria bacterium]|nr:chemotaxis protein CheA [Pseudomonadota bacterium]